MIPKWKLPNKVIQNLTIADFFFWGGYGLISPLLSIFIVEQIPNTTIEIATIATSLSYLPRVFEIPIGSIMDKIKGNTDELSFLSIGNLLAGISSIVLALSTDIIHIYIAQLLFGLGVAIQLPAWRILFTQFIDKGKEGKDWATTDTLTSASLTGSMFISGILAMQWSIRTVFVIAGILSIISSIFPIFIRPYIARRDHKV